jgi:3-methyladenine DNA glycosylase AlkD
VIADALSAYVSKTPLALMKMERWTQSRDEWVGTVGWNLMAHLAMTHRSLSDDYFEQYLRVIERDIHNSKNRVRYAMNGALIAIGSRSADLERKALGVANTIGEVYVDHGETGCKTPDARAYIPKARARKK